LNAEPDFIMLVRTMMRIARRAVFVLIGMPLIAACGGSREAEQPSKPATATLAVEGMT
jgi:hypothetical protein